MKTTFRIKKPYADAFLRLASETNAVGTLRPKHFIHVMQCNRGAVAGITGMGYDDDGLERKNPLVVALGDSVTAGHFEWLGGSPIEITDATQCYLDKFRLKLIEKYEQTSVSVINSGIAGDILPMMCRRAYRDVIRYQPDLVILNGALNWSDALGTTAFYKSLLTDLVRRIQHETSADVVLLTPNGIVADAHQEATLAERVEAIREVAKEQNTCFADVYAIWEKAKAAGIPWKELLSNGLNHPSVEGHEVYALTLMKLFA